MNEAELKDLIRDAVRRRLAAAGGIGADAPSAAPAATATAVHHASHDVYLTLVNPGGACLIEPAVLCNHCNYCKSHGH